MFRYLFFIIFVASFSFAKEHKEPQFHYQECVKITAGFYKGCNGKASFYDEEYDRYEVEGKCKGDSFNVNVDGYNLARCDK